MDSELPANVIDDICREVFAGRKIPAIKIYREASGAGLKESKDFIEALQARLYSESPEKFTVAPGKGIGCGATVLALAFAVAACLTWLA